jgi:hypothetical protein
MALEKEPVLLDHGETASKILLHLRELEMSNQGEPNEVLAFKFHYLGTIVRDTKKGDEKFNLNFACVYPFFKCSKNSCVTMKNSTSTLLVSMPSLNTRKLLCSE